MYLGVLIVFIHRALIVLYLYLCIVLYLYNSSYQDIKTRKALAWKALNGIKSIWKSNISRELKIRFFRATVESILLYGCESWALNVSMEKSLDGCYTWMLRAAMNIDWRDHVSNQDLYGELPRISDRVAWRRLGLAGHCHRHPEIPAHHLILWEPTHGSCRQGRPANTYVDTLKRDSGAANTDELVSCMNNRHDWASRRAARLRSP